jgi:hypothetical protein
MLCFFGLNKLKNFRRGFAAGIVIKGIEFYIDKVDVCGVATAVIFATPEAAEKAILKELTTPQEGVRRFVKSIKLSSNRRESFIKWIKKDEEYLWLDN